MSVAAGASTVFGALVVVVGVFGTLRSPAEAAPRLAASLALALELFLAAGLLRLAEVQTFGAIGLVGAIVVLRRLLVVGIALAVRTTS